MLSLIGGMKTEPIMDGSERVGFEVIDIKTGDRATIAHKANDSRTRVLGYGIDTEALESVAIPAIEFAKDYCEVMVIDEIGKFAVESEYFVETVREALEVDKPTLLALHKKPSSIAPRYKEEEMMQEFLKLHPSTGLCFLTRFTN